MRRNTARCRIPAEACKCAGGPKPTSRPRTWCWNGRSAAVPARAPRTSKASASISSIAASPTSCRAARSCASPPADFAGDYQRIERGRIYIAPPDHHLLVCRDTLRLGHGPRENNARPAVDPLFRSAAVCCGPHTIGLVLTGYLNDGSSGLNAIKRCGGITVVQDPEDAAFPEMPRNAIRMTNADHVVSLVKIPDLLMRLVQVPEGEPGPVLQDIRLEADIAIAGHNGTECMEELGNRS